MDVPDDDEPIQLRSPMDVVLWRLDVDELAVAARVCGGWRDTAERVAQVGTWLICPRRVEDVDADLEQDLLVSASRPAVAERDGVQAAAGSVAAALCARRRDFLKRVGSMRCAAWTCAMQASRIATLHILSFLIERYMRLNRLCSCGRILSQ